MFALAHVPFGRGVLTGALVATATLCCSAQARADVSSWMFVGAGPSFTADGKAALGSQASLQLESGLGTLPASGLSFGGLMRLQTHFEQGSDVALLLRSASHGYVHGDWGVAIDVGGFQRWWGIGSSGVLGALVLGAPWGLSASFGGGVGTNETRLLSAVIGIDVARLTVYRSSGLNFWPNPYPARAQAAR